MSHSAIINKIARKSKTMHIPVRQSIQKTFLAKAIAKEVDMSVLSKISLRDKFKFLNLLAYKKQQNTVDAFVVRNGKIFTKEDRAVWDKADIMRVERAVVSSIAEELVHLRDKKILVDENIKLGLPISRKQTLGNLPFGTRVAIDAERVSAGIYWENSYGANDLDLSAVNEQGERTGWGSYEGYGNENDVIYSGDVVDAPKGAMEFMTSSDSTYAVFVNVYNGKEGTKFEMLFGSECEQRKVKSDGFVRESGWMETPVLREEVVATSRYMMFGTVRGKEFVVFEGRLGSRAVSESGVHPAMSRALTDFWTVNQLFDAIGVEYTTVAEEGVEYDHDLTYAGFTIEKLEEVFV